MPDTHDERGGDEAAAIDEARTALGSSKRTRFGRVFVEHLLAECDGLQKQLAAATARAEKAERQFNLVRSLNRLAKANAVELHAQLDAVRARIAELGEPEVEQRIVSPSGLVYEPTLRDLENQAYWLPGVRLEERQVYPTPWRVAANAAQDGRSATETDDGAIQAAGVELEFGKGAAGLSELCPCGCTKIGDGCNCRFCNEPYPTQQPSDDTNGADR